MWLSIHVNIQLERGAQATGAEPISAIFRYRPKTKLKYPGPYGKSVAPPGNTECLCFPLGNTPVQGFLEGIYNPKLPVPGLDKFILRAPPGAGTTA